MHIDEHDMLGLTVNDFIGESVAILGIKGSGKSNTAAVIAEELLLAGAPVAIVDIAGEYHTLRDECRKLAIVGASIETEVDLRLDYSNASQVAEKAYLNGIPVIIDLSAYDDAMREEILGSYFRRVWSLAAVNRFPLVVFLEEAHNYLPQQGKSNVSDLFIKLATEGRKRGLSLIMIGQRSARISKDTLTQAGISFLHHVTHPSDLKVYTEMIPRMPRKVREMVRSLEVGEALITRSNRVLRYQIRLRRTRHVGFTPSLQDAPVSQLSLLDLLNEPS